MVNNLMENEYTLVEDNVIILHETLERFIENFLNDKKYRSKETYSAYKCDINKLARDLFGYKDYSYIKKEDIESVSMDDLVDYFNMCIEESFDVNGERKYSNKTINRRMSSLKSLFEYLAVRDKIKYDILKLKSKSILRSLPDTSIEIDVLDKEDAVKCIEFFKTLYKGNEMYLIGKLGLDTSLRANELLTLTWKQFTVNGEVVNVNSRGDIKGKGNKNWSKEISLELYKELLTLKSDKEEVFTLNYQNLARGMKNAINHLELTDGKYSFHSIRKTAITHAYYSSGADIMVAMQEANHSKPETTMKYIKKVKNGKIGMISSQNDDNSVLYEDVPHEQLLKAIDGLDDISKMKLNEVLSKMMNN